MPIREQMNGVSHPHGLTPREFSDALGRPAAATLDEPEAGPDAGPEADSPVDRDTLDYLFSITYEELRRLAASVRHDDTTASLSPTALVNEAWLKLAKAPPLQTMSRLHFKRIAARAMRQILVEAARRRHATKRGGDDAIRVTFEETLHESVTEATELIALNDALDALAQLEPRQAVMVESRFFGGLDVTETAELLHVSEATILRDWRVAKAWLAQEITRARY